jgi:hypothetical protein
VFVSPLYSKWLYSLSELCRNSDQNHQALAEHHPQSLIRDGSKYGKLRGNNVSPNRDFMLICSRTHRQRTQTYMKTMEREVLRLRASENEALLKIQRLQRQVDLLLATLVENNINFPPGLMEDQAALHSDLLPLSRSEAQVQVNLNPRDESSLIGLDFQQGWAGISLRSEVEESRGSAGTVDSAIPIGHENYPLSSAAVRTASFSPNSQPSILQDPHIGIDFVLAYVFLLVAFFLFADTPETRATMPGSYQGESSRWRPQSLCFRSPLHGVTVLMAANRSNKNKTRDI